nr:hypothetical protein Iba_chr15aCG12100 [Ipomoea batatas]
MQERRRKWEDRIWRPGVQRWVVSSKGVDNTTDGPISVIWGAEELASSPPGRWGRGSSKTRSAMADALRSGCRAARITRGDLPDQMC